MTTTTEFFSIFQQYWPFLIPLCFVVVLAFLGKEAYSLYRAFDNSLARVLGHLPRLIGVNNRPYTFWDIWFRRLTILLFFGTFLGVAVWMIVNPPQNLPFPAGVIELLCVAVAYIFALSTAKQWVLNETYILDGDEEASTAANHLKNVGGFSIIVLVICVPISLHSLAAIFGEDFTGKIDGSDGAGTGDFLFWAWYSLKLLYDAVADLGSLILNGKYEIDEPTYWLTGIVLFHLLVFTFIVIQGVIILAKGEYALTNALKQLKRTGDVDKIIPFGERITDELEDFINHQDPLLRDKLKKVDCRTTRDKRIHAIRAIRALGEIASTDRNTTRRSVNKLIEVFTGKIEHCRRDERMAAGEALWIVGKEIQEAQSAKPFLGGTRLLLKIREVFREITFCGEDPGVGVRTSAIDGLSELKVLSNAHQLEKLTELLTNSTSPPLKRAIAKCLVVHQGILSPDVKQSIGGILADLYLHESDRSVRTRIGDALRNYDESFYHGTVVEYEEILHDHEYSWQERIKAAEVLGEEIADDDNALTALITSDDQVIEVRKAVVKAIGEASELRNRVRRREAIRSLEDYYGDESWEVRNRAASTLGRFTRDVNRVSAIMSRRLFNDEPERIPLIRSVCKALARLDALDELVDALSSPQFSARDHAGKALIRCLEDKYEFDDQQLEKVRELAVLPETIKITDEERQFLKKHIAREIEETQRERTEVEPYGEAVTRT